MNFKGTIDRVDDLWGKQFIQGDFVYSLDTNDFLLYNGKDFVRMTTPYITYKYSDSTEVGIPSENAFYENYFS